MSKLSLRKNNQGSTLVFVIVTIIFVGLLASLILAMSVASFQIRNVDVHSNQNFLTGETYSDEVYNYLGMTTLGVLGESYNSVMGQLKGGNIASDDSLNKELKHSFYKNMLTLFHIHTQSEVTSAAYVLGVPASSSSTSLDLVHLVNNFDTSTMTSANTQIEEIVKIIDQGIGIDYNNPTNLSGLNVVNPQIQSISLDIYGDVYCNLKGIIVTEETVDADGDGNPDVDVNGNVIKKNKFIYDYDGTKMAAGSIATYKDYYPTILIKDIRINYVGYIDSNYDGTYDSNDQQYESSYTFDALIRYPDWDFNYVNPASSGSDLNTFIDYVLISDSFINFKSGSPTVRGNIAAGSNLNGFASSSAKDITSGIVVSAGSHVTVNANPNNRYIPLAVVTSDDILVDNNGQTDSSLTINGNRGAHSGDATYSNFYVNRAQVWANNIKVTRDTAGNATTSSNRIGSTINLLGGDLEVYLQDDLQVDSNGSSITMSNVGGGTGGYLFAYSMRTGATDVDRSYSSAVIVNGVNSKLTLNLNRLYICGISYVVHTKAQTGVSDAAVRTGESLTVRGDQALYLVPPELDVFATNGYNNPLKMATTTAAGTVTTNDATTVNNIVLGAVTELNTAMTNYAGTGRYAGFLMPGDLDTTNPIKTITVNKSNASGTKTTTYTYFYMNFSTVARETAYADRIITAATTETKGKTTIVAGIVNRAEANLSSMVEMTPAEIASGLKPVIADVSALSQTTTGTVLFSALGGEEEGDLDHDHYFSAADAILVTNQADSMRNRYRLMKSMLLPTNIDVSLASPELVADYNNIMRYDLAATFKYYAGKATTCTPAEQPYYENKRDSFAEYVDNPASTNPSARATKLKATNTTRSIFTNMINLTNLEDRGASSQDGSGVWKANVTGSSHTGNVWYTTLDDYTITGNFTGVFVTSGKVTVRGSVTGLIVARGGITVENGGQYISDAAMVDDILRTGQCIYDDASTKARCVSDVFCAYQPENPTFKHGETVGTLMYSDVVEYKNWRKYDDEPATVAGP